MLDIFVVIFECLKYHVHHIAHPCPLKFLVARLRLMFMHDGFSLFRVVSQLDNSTIVIAVFRVTNNVK